MKLLDQTLSSWSLLFLSIGIALYAIIGYGLMEAGDTVHPNMKAVYTIHKEGIYLHIFSSLIALLLGPFLLSEPLRNRYTHYHRLGGKLYLVTVLFGGLGGLYMAFYSYGGVVSTFGFGMLALLWLFTGYRGLRAILSGDLPLHRQWMIRNFALTFSAVTFRIWLGLFFASGIPFEEFYPIISWICWVPNLLFVEWVIFNSVNHN